MANRLRTLFGQWLDRCFRVAFRLAYPCAEIVWRYRRHDGVQIVVWLDDRVLGVLHSYRPGWAVPGGGIKHGEDHRCAARRELWEEVGVAIAETDLRLVVTRQKTGGRGFCYLYETRLPAEPDLRIDCREIVAAQFLSPIDLIAVQDNFITRYLRAQARPAPIRVRTDPVRVAREVV
jgi:8-oxo-dGTP pyrophosphatase MutT (NUDIX family)